MHRALRVPAKHLKKTEKPILAAAVDRALRLPAPEKKKRTKRPRPKSHAHLAHLKFNQTVSQLNSKA